MGLQWDTELYQQRLDIYLWPTSLLLLPGGFSRTVSMGAGPLGSQESPAPLLFESPTAT